MIIRSFAMNRKGIFRIWMLILIISTTGVISEGKVHSHFFVKAILVDNLFFKMRFVRVPIFKRRAGQFEIANLVVFLLIQCNNIDNLKMIWGHFA